MQRIIASDRRSPFLSGSLVVMAGCLVLAGAAAGGTEVEIDGTLHVQNGSTPAHGVDTLRLEEVWRAGGNDDETFFGIVTQVRVDDNGDVYLLDTQLSEAQVYSADGEHLRTLSSQGEGPGQTNQPSDMLFMPDGTVGLVQTFPGKIVQVDKQGDPAGEFKPFGGDPTRGGFVALIDVKQHGGNLVLSGVDISVDQANATQDRTHFLASFDMEGNELVRYLEKKDRWDFKNFTFSEKGNHFVHRRGWTMGPDGKVYAAPERNEYRINVYATDGTLERVIEREYTSWERDERAEKLMQAVLNGTRRQFPFEIKVETEKTEPDITFMHVTPNGELWVLPSRGNQDQPDGIMMTYDVFDPAGHFTRQVAIACEGDGWNDGLFFAGDDSFVRVTRFMDAFVALQGGVLEDDEATEEDLPMEVIYHRAAGPMAAGAGGQ